MAENFQMKMEALKKSYAEMILKASKDECLRLFLRFHDHFHFKITEAETRSLNQQMKIEVLEAQLSEAEEIIVDLREQLNQVQDQLETARESNNLNKLLKGQIPSAHELINESEPLDNEKSYTVSEFNMSDAKSDHNSDGMVVYKCDQAVAGTTWSAESELNHYHVSKDGISSFGQPNRETYLFKNGCTERVCAIERKPVTELSPLVMVQTLENYHSENRLEKSDNSSQCPVIENSHISGDPIFCEKLDDSNQHQLTNLSTALNSGNSSDKPSSVSSPETEKNEKIIQNGLGEQVGHESGSHKAQESRSCRRSLGKNARYREAISVLSRSRRKKPLRSWKKPLSRQQTALSSGGENESVEVPIEQIDKMPKTEVCGTTKSVNDLIYRETLFPSDTRLVDSNLVNVPIIDGSNNQRCSNDKGKVLKFTFYRRRQKNVLTNIDENIVTDRSTVKRKM